MKSDVEALLREIESIRSDWRMTNGQLGADGTLLNNVESCLRDCIDGIEYEHALYKEGHFGRVAEEEEGPTSEA